MPTKESAYQNAYRRRDPERFRRWRRGNIKVQLTKQRAQKKSNWKLKLEALAAYGNRCACCGEANPYFLSIDHIDNNGAAHRRETGCGTGNVMYRWLRARDWPEGFQIACFNCNFAKGHYGFCPHATMPQLAERM